MRMSQISGRRAASAVTLTDIAQDMTVLQRVGSAKDITVSGTSNGSHVTVQAIDAVSGAVIAERDRVKVAAGSFAGTLSVPHGGWYKLKVIDSRQSGIHATGSNRFGVGVVVGMAGQSNMNGLMNNTAEYPLGSALAVEYQADTYRRIGNINDAYPPGTLWPTYSTFTASTNRGDGYVHLANLLSSGLGGVPVCLVNRAVNGSSITSWQAGQSNLTTLSSAIAAAGGDMELFIWLQGETDAVSMTKDTYKTNLGNVHALTRAMTPRAVADFKFGVISLGVGSYLGSADGDFGKIRTAHVEYVAENTGAFHAASAHDVITSDGVHITGAGQSKIGRRAALSALGALSGQNKSGPRIASASRAGNVVTLTIEHRGGSALQDGSGGAGTALTGFAVFDGATEVAISATAIASATSIQLTLASTPTGAVTVSYATSNCPHGTASSVTLASAVYDNQPVHGSSVGMLLTPVQSMSVA